MEYRDQITEINRRIAKIDQRIIDLIVPMQGIVGSLKDRTPIEIKTEKLKILLSNFQSEMQKFESVINDFRNMQQTLTYPGEIKYIGNRLNEIEKILKKLLQDQPKKEVQIQFSCDGYEMVKKPMHYDN